MCKIIWKIEVNIILSFVCVYTDIEILPLTTCTVYINPVLNVGMREEIKIVQTECALFCRNMIIYKTKLLKQIALLCARKKGLARQQLGFWTFITHNLIRLNKKHSSSSCLKSFFPISNTKFSATTVEF